MTFVSLSQAIVEEKSNALDSAVGNTPLMLLRRLGANLSPRIQIMAKAEWFNPGGSIKDRPARSIMETALSDGLLISGQRLLDSTSGNMGISYATLGAAVGIKVTLAIPANASPERLKILRTLGAELVLTDPLEGPDGAIRTARQMTANEPKRYFYANQYNNPANWMAHYTSTGPEIVHQSEGRVTHFIAGLGTSGTLMGVGRYLRQYDPEINIFAVQPDSPFHGLEGLKHLPTSIRPEIYEPTIADACIEVSTEDAYEMVLRLAREEGLFVGVSSGAAAAAALKVASGLEEGVVVTVFPDAGYKYLSESFWEKVR